MLPSGFQNMQQVPIVGKLDNGAENIHWRRNQCFPQKIFKLMWNLLSQQRSTVAADSLAGEETPKHEQEQGLSCRT